MNAVTAENLCKEFIVVKKRPGLRGAFASLIHPVKTLVRAVDDVSFSIPAGEIVGYLGPNGSGKSTTIKMLTGVLHPTSGSVLLSGIDPQKERKRAVKRIGVVFGQRTQLFWDLRLGESFELLRHIYDIPKEEFKSSLAQIREELKVESLLNIPVRQLSLGQRMRAEVAAALLHSPSILFLDEPTIGLDIDAKRSIREIIKSKNRLYGTTVILTTHDLEDVEELCSRLIVISQGSIVADDSLSVLVRRLSPHRILAIEFTRPQPQASHPVARVIRNEGIHCEFSFDPAEVSLPFLISDIAARFEVRDLKVKEPRIEDVVRQLYKNSATASTADE